MSNINIRATIKEDRQWVNQFILEAWNDEIVVVHGQIYYPADLPGFVATINNQFAGLVTYRIGDNDCELITLNSVMPDFGVGKSLVHEVLSAAQRSGSRRVWLITTNDNLEALSFYQKLGFRLTKLYPNAVENARRIKPTIPKIGNHGIPLRDELELEILI
jgi:ribosomal protein S18 acetylase RimI-like enzyme